MVPERHCRDHKSPRTGPRLKPDESHPRLHLSVVMLKMDSLGSMPYASWCIHARTVDAYEPLGISTLVRSALTVKKTEIYLCKYSQTEIFSSKERKEFNSGTRCVPSERKQLRYMQRGIAVPTRETVCAKLKACEHAMWRKFKTFSNEERANFSTDRLTLKKKAIYILFPKLYRTEKS